MDQQASVSGNSPLVVSADSDPEPASVWQGDNTGLCKPGVLGSPVPGSPGKCLCSHGLGQEWGQSLQMIHFLSALAGEVERGGGLFPHTLD